jgi:lipopolysaccharide export system permease protein
VNQFTAAQWDSLLDPDLLDVVVVKPERLSISGLFKYIQFLNNNGQDASPYQLAFSSKLVRPLVALSMLLVAIPFVLGVQRSGSIGSRILIGAILGIGFTLVERLFGNVGLVYGLNPVVAATLPFFLVTSTALYAIKRMH